MVDHQAVGRNTQDGDASRQGQDSESNPSGVDDVDQASVGLTLGLQLERLSLDFKLGRRELVFQTGRHFGAGGWGYHWRIQVKPVTKCRRKINTREGKWKQDEIEP